MKTLDEIRTELERRASLIGATEDDLPTYGYSRDFARPHIEVDESSYHYVVVERGEELLRQSTPELEELVYWVFSSVTHNLAFAHELNNRIEGQDCRRIGFQKQLELLRLIDPAMAARKSEEIAEILREAPYDDRAEKK